MKTAVLLTISLALTSASAASAQSRVADIYAEMANNAARAAQARADAWSKMIAELTALAAAAVPAPRMAPVVTPVVETPNPSSADMQRRYLEEALAYEKENDLARVAALVARVEGRVSAPLADCGIKPIKPIPPIGCRDLVAQCVVDGRGNASWQWVCLK
jgi:hypothetical protein